MEAHLCGHNVILVRAVFLDTVLTCHLDHCLICLSTGILEEDLIHADGRADLLSQKCLRNRIRIVEGVHNITDLILHSFNDLLITASGAVYCDTCVKIQIALTVLIIEIHILCSLCKKIETLIGLDHIFVYLVLDVLCG